MKCKVSWVINKKELIFKDVLIELCDKYIDDSDLLIVRNLIMILFCFVGFFRFDEVSFLKFKDVYVYDEYIVLNI